MTVSEERIQAIELEQMRIAMEHAQNNKMLSDAIDRLNVSIVNMSKGMVPISEYKFFRNVIIAGIGATLSAVLVAILATVVH